MCGLRVKGGLLDWDSRFLTMKHLARSTIPARVAGTQVPGKQASTSCVALRFGSSPK